MNKKDYKDFCELGEKYEKVQKDYLQLECKIKDEYISKKKIREKINELTLKNRIPIKDQFVMYDMIKRDFQIEILNELLGEK